MDYLALTNLAFALGLTPTEAVALPAVVERCALSVEKSPAAFVRLVETNSRLGDYVVELCRTCVAA